MADGWWLMADGWSWIHCRIESFLIVFVANLIHRRGVILIYHRYYIRVMAGSSSLLGEQAEDAEECEEGEEAKTDLEGMMEHINIENNIARLSGLSLKTSTSRSRNGSSGGPGKTRCPTVLPASYNGRNSLFLFADSFIIPTYFSFQLSTQENYGEEDRDFRGPFKEIRANLDFVSWWVTCVRERWCVDRAFCVPKFCVHKYGVLLSECWIQAPLLRRMLS